MGACLTPFLLKEKLKDEMLVPCGKCPECLKKRASAWSFRLLQEERRSSSAYCLTLTYDNKNVPITPNRFMSLSRGKGSDMQLYFKLLRRKHERAGFCFNPEIANSRSIKYYYVGEYGGETFRPHYHVILFNAQLELIIGARNKLVIDKLGFDRKRQIHEDVWNKGHIGIDLVTPASVGYCLKYMTKEPFIGLHERDDRAKEFACMSKGLGAEYLTDEMKAWHYADPFNRMYCNLTDGKKIGMPRYYKNKLYDDDLRKEIGMKARADMIRRQLEEYSTLSEEQRMNLIHTHDDKVKKAFADMYADVKQSRELNF